MLIQVNTSREILNQIGGVISQLTDSQYASPLRVLSGNSIGKHVRHILEFYDCLNKGYASASVDYDSRQRNLLLETSTASALSSIEHIISFLGKVTDKPVVLLTRYPGSEIPANSASSFKREIIYNIEHAIHHMAMIRIALSDSFPEVKPDKDFGVAYSTVKYQKEQCAQ